MTFLISACDRITVSTLFVLTKETKPNVDDASVASQSVKPSVVR